MKTSWCSMCKANVDETGRIIEASVPDATGVSDTPEHWCETHNKPQYLIRDPYAWEIDDEEVMMWLCEDCEQDRCDDI